MWNWKQMALIFLINNTTNKGLSIVVWKYSYHRHIAFYARLELHCCLELKPNGGQKGYHRMSTLRLERFDFVISALWGMGFTNWICVTSPVSDQAYFTFWKPAKVRQTENENLFWLDNFFSRSLHVLALEQIEIFSTKLSGSDKRPSKLPT